MGYKRKPTFYELRHTSDQLPVSLKLLPMLAQPIAQLADAAGAQSKLPGHGASRLAQRQRLRDLSISLR